MENPRFERPLHDRGSLGLASAQARGTGPRDVRRIADGSPAIGSMTDPQAIYHRISPPTSWSNVSFSELSKPPYKAAVTFQRVIYTPGTRHERSRQTFVAQVDFVFRDHVPNEFVRVNPLGLEIRYFRVDQAFEEPR